MTRENTSLTGRPSRRRKEVNHYTDSNPSTFTVKRKKGDPESPPVAANNHNHRGNESTTTTAAASRVDRRRQKARSTSSTNKRSLPASSKSQTAASSSTTIPITSSRTAAATSSSAFASNNNNNGNHKRSPKRRRRIVTLVAAESADGSSSGASSTAGTAVVPQDEILSHALTVHPVLPVQHTHPSAAAVSGSSASLFSASASGQQQHQDFSLRYPMVYHNQSLQEAPAAPSWTPVPVPLPTAYPTTQLLSGTTRSLSPMCGNSGVAAALTSAGTTATSASSFATITALSSSVSSEQQQAQPPITCFSTSLDGRVATGDAAGGVTLYRMNMNDTAGTTGTTGTSAAGTSVMRPICHVRTTSASAREQERMVTSKRVIRYPNAVTSCHWWHRNQSTRQRQRSTSTTIAEQSSSLRPKGDLILVWTVDELEALIMGGENDDDDDAYKNEARVVWRIALSPVWSKTSGPLSPSSLDFTQAFSNGDTDSDSNIVLWTCQGRLPLDEKDADVSLYRLEWKDNDVNVTTDSATAVPETTVTGGLADMDMDMDDADMDVAHACPAHGPIVHRSVVLPIVDSPEPYTTETWTCLTAIWDTWQEQQQQRDSNGNTRNQKRIVLVGQSRSRPDHWELMRLHDTTKKIQQQTVIEGCGRSTAASVSVTLQQDKGASYTFLSSHKGIRLYDTENLSLLQTYGDTVQLHGKTVTWQSALWIPAPGGKSAVDETSSREQQQVVRTTTVGSNKKQSWLERKDELAYRDGWSPSDEHWLIGIPHPTKGPMELNSTMYVWKPGQAQAVTTLQAPVGGLLGACSVTDFTGWRFLSATSDPNGIWECRATMKSDFAGVMYPVGYQVISDNLEYIEDEDELDLIVTVHDEEENSDDDDGSESADEAVDQDLADALRLSLLEQQKKTEAEEGKKERIVSVMLDADDDKDDDEPVACWPDPSLQEQLHFNCEGSGKSPVKESPYKKSGVLSEVFSALPAFKMVQRDLLLRREQDMERLSPSPSEEGGNGSASSMLPSRPKSKRTRTANVEALLQTSVDPCLRRKMSRLHKQWSDGSKSTLRASDLGVAIQDTAVAKLDGIPTDEAAKQVNGFGTTHSASGEDVTVPFPEEEGEESEVISNGEKRVTEGESQAILVKGGDPSVLLPMAAASDANSTTTLVQSAEVKGEANVEETPQPEENLVNGGDPSALPPMEAADSDRNSTASLAQPVDVNDEAHRQKMPQPDSKPSAEQIVTSASAEEKELALELLLLSPGKSSPTETDMSAATSIPVVKAESQNLFESEVLNGVLETSNDSKGVKEDSSFVVSPSEQSPVQAPAAEGHRGKGVTSQEDCKALLCAACRGRMVIHSCGKREKPVDYEALARVEKEEKEREEVEKQRIRTEKRRAAEAKRREARREKKEEAERKIQETHERMRRLEAEQFEKAHIREQEEETMIYSRHTGQNQSDESLRPLISPLKTHSTQAVPAFSEPDLGQRQVSHGFEQERPYYHQGEARSTPLTTTEAPHASHSSQDGYYHYSETPVPASTSTVHTWDAQQYPSSSFVQDRYYGHSHSAPLSTGQAWEDAPNHASSASGSHEYRSESAPPIFVSSVHGPHDGNHQGFEQAPPARASVQTEFASSMQSTSNSHSSRTPFSVDASELKPSMSLSTTDALAALAGLANSMPVATSHGFGAYTETTEDETWTGYSQAGPSEARGPYSEHGTSYGYAATGNGYDQGYSEGSYYNEKSWPSHHGSSNGSAPLSSLVAPQAAAVTFSNGSDGYTNDAHMGEAQGPSQPPI